MTLGDYLRARTDLVGSNDEITSTSGDFIAIEQVACVSPLLRLAAIRVAGPDARQFLHGQLTSDVRQVTTAHGQLSAWCTPQGRVSFLFFLVEDAAGFLLFSPSVDSERLVGRLRMFVLRAQVEIENQSDAVALLGVSLPASPAHPLPFENFPTKDLAVATLGPALKALCIDGARRYLVWGEVAAVAAWWEACGLTRIGTAAWRALDIAHRLPTLDNPGVNAYLPQQLNLDDRGAVSFDKGCFPGQEIIARLKYRGEVKSRIVAGAVAGVATVGTKLYRAGAPPNSVGEIVLAVATAPDENRFLAVVDLSARQARLHLHDARGPTVCLDPR